jgi:hypothetical protein
LKERAMRTTPRFLIGMLLVCGLWLVTGCETTEQNRESDIPWNQPQPWEGAPGIPGMNGQ